MYSTTLVRLKAVVKLILSTSLVEKVMGTLCYYSLCIKRFFCSVCTLPDTHPGLTQFTHHFSGAYSELIYRQEADNCPRLSDFFRFAEMEKDILDCPLSVLNFLNIFSYGQKNRIQLRPFVYMPKHLTRKFVTKNIAILVRAH